MNPWPIGKETKMRRKPIELRKGVLPIKTQLSIKRSFFPLAQVLTPSQEQKMPPKDRLSRVYRVKYLPGS